MSTKALARALLLAHGKPALRIHREAYDAARTVMRQLRSQGKARKVSAPGEEEMWDLVREE
jgi:hypothetical protein